MSEPFTWTCPYCARPVTIRDEDCVEYLHPFDYDKKRTVHGEIGLRIFAIACPNVDCRKLLLRVMLSSTRYDHVVGPISVETLQSWQLMPQSEAKPQPDYIPAAIVEDYNEACLIRDLSPKASATLSRRCLQGMIRDFWKVKGKPNLWEEIEAIDDKVDELTWKAIHGVREIGNIGAHMKEDINLIVNVEPKEAQVLIGLIEMLFKDWYVARKEKEDRVADMIALSEAKKQPVTEAKAKAAEEPPDEG